MSKILLYHGVTDWKKDPRDIGGCLNYNGKHIGVDEFEKQMKWLSENKKVVSLTVNDFEYLTSTGIFKVSLMDETIFAFKRIEHESLHYSGYTNYKPKEIGLGDTKISIEEFNKL